MTTNSKTPTTFLEKLKAKLKLGDEGKVMSFFEREVKKQERSIKNLTTNRNTLTSTHESDLEDLNDQLADAKEAVEAAYFAITPEQVANNALQDSFSTTFWGNITRAENKVKSIEESIADLKKAHRAKLDDNQEQIDKYKARLKAIQE